MQGSTSPFPLTIGTNVVAFLLLLGSAFVGRLFDAGYLRSVIICGSVLLVFTTCMTSLSTEWYQLFLSQGIGAGIAVGMYIPPHFTPPNPG